MVGGSSRVRVAFDFTAQRDPISLNEPVHKRHVFPMRQRFDSGLIASNVFM